MILRKERATIAPISGLGSNEEGRGGVTGALEAVGGGRVPA